MHDAVVKEKDVSELKIGRDTVRCLRALHAAGVVHNDVKPLNILYGAAGSGREADAHLLDFGTATSVEAPAEGGAPAAASESGLGGELVAGVVRTPAISTGGGIPLFASVAQLTGRRTSPVDDVESLWYCLAFLTEGQVRPRSRSLPPSPSPPFCRLLPPSDAFSPLPSPSWPRGSCRGSGSRASA